jgi:hypothetical protein
MRGIDLRLHRVGLSDGTALEMEHKLGDEPEYLPSVQPRAALQGDRGAVQQAFRAGRGMNENEIGIDEMESAPVAKLVAYIRNLRRASGCGQAESLLERVTGMKKFIDEVVTPFASNDRRWAVAYQDEITDLVVEHLGGHL